MRAAFGLVLVAAMAGGARAADDDASKADAKALQGKWQVTAVVKNGEEDGGIKGLELEFAFTGDKLRVTSATNKQFGPLDRFMRLGASGDPKVLDLGETEKGFDTGDGVIEGVYTLDGDTFRWCFALDGDQPAKRTRPAAVESRSGSNSILITLKRMKD